MTDQDRANAFIARLQGKAVVSHHPLTSHQTKPTNLTPQRKAKIAVNQTRQRGINQQERHVRTELNRDEALKNREKRDPLVLREIHYTPKLKNPPRGNGLRYANYDSQEVRTPATRRERLRALEVNEDRRKNRRYTESPEAVMRTLQPPYTVMAGIPSFRREWHGSHAEQAAQED